MSDARESPFKGCSPLPCGSAGAPDHAQPRSSTRQTGRWSRPIESRADRALAWADMLLRDGGLWRMAYLNMHQIADGVWRSGQPTPGQLRAFARRGGRTVVSLRAGRDFGSLPLEREACRDADLTFHNLPVRSHALPSRSELRAAAKLLSAMPRPALLHCKSGADRSGFAAALYLMLVEDRPLAEARRQLALRYGHRRHGRAGLLDAFFDSYERNTTDRPVSLMEWAETRYDPDGIAAAYRAGRFGGLMRARNHREP